MNTFVIIIGFILLLIFLLLVIRLWLNKIEEKTRSFDNIFELFKDLSRRVDSSTIQIDQKLSQNMNMFNNRLDRASQVISDVQKTIGEFSEIGRSMQELQEFLQSPKLRGNIGEQILKELLAQHFPKGAYNLQHAFKNGEKVDAVIKTSLGLIPIDSKFPLENFRKMIRENNQLLKDKCKKEFISDVKKHISDISKKYILVEEGTSDYALMYIPSESIYYEIISDSDLYDYSGKQRVLAVSPMSFYAYMKAILMSYEGQRIQSQAKQILIVLQAIKKDYEKSEESLSTLHKHITNAYNQMAHVTKNFLTLGQKLSSTNLLPQTDEQKKLTDQKE